MIHIDLSVEPHSKNVTWSEDDPLVPASYSKPPHYIFQKEFETADEAQSFLHLLSLNDKDHSIAMSVVEAAGQGEYVGVEVEVRESTGKEYTKACLSIEGRQDPNWELIMDETRRAMIYIDTDGYAQKQGFEEFRDLLNGAYAAAHAVLTHANKV